MKLIVLDSIAALLRTEFGGGEAAALAARGEALGQHASALKAVAEAARIPVVVTNQVCVCFRLVLGLFWGLGQRRGLPSEPLQAWSRLGVYEFPPRLDLWLIKATKPSFRHKNNHLCLSASVLCR